jgi:hypothetical protein
VWRRRGERRGGRGRQHLGEKRKGWDVGSPDCGVGPEEGAEADGRSGADARERKADALRSLAEPFRASGSSFRYALSSSSLPRRPPPSPAAAPRPPNRTTTLPSDDAYAPALAQIPPPARETVAGSWLVGAACSRRRRRSRSAPTTTPLWRPFKPRTWVPSCGSLSLSRITCISSVDPDSAIPSFLWLRWLPPREI